MDIQQFFLNRLDRGAIPLLVGDIVVILGLLTAGAYQHTPTLISDFTFMSGLFAPFVIGWGLVAPAIGAYSPGATETPKAAIPLALRSWIPTAVIALGLRYAGVFRGDAAPAFAIVILVLGMVGLGVWRFLYFKLR